MGLADSLTGLTETLRNRSSLSTLFATLELLSARGRRHFRVLQFTFEPSIPPRPRTSNSMRRQTPKGGNQGLPSPRSRSALPPFHFSLRQRGTRPCSDVCILLSRRASLSKRPRKCVSAPSRPPGPGRGTSGPRRTRLQPPRGLGAAAGPPVPEVLVGRPCLRSSGSALTDSVG